MIDAPLTPSYGRSLMDAYEALRQEVVGMTNGGRLIQGRALLMFKGMATWMKHMTEVFEHHDIPVVAPSESSLPVGLERDLIEIIVTMTLANTLEDAA